MSEPETAAEEPRSGAPPAAGGKSRTAFRTISEVADELDVAQHVLRFWESKFMQVRPLKRGGGRRYYRPEDVALLREIRALLYDQGYTIKGAQKLIRSQRSAKSKARQPSLALTDVTLAEGQPSGLHQLRKELVALRAKALKAFDVDR